MLVVSCIHTDMSNCYLVVVVPYMCVAQFVPMQTCPIVTAHRSSGLTCICYIYPLARAFSCWQPTLHISFVRVFNPYLVSTEPMLHFCPDECACCGLWCGSSYTNHETASSCRTLGRPPRQRNRIVINRDCDKISPRCLGMTR